MYEAHVLLLYGFAPFVRLLHPGRKLKVKSASAQGGKSMRQLLILVALLQPIVAPAQRSDAENPPEVSDQATLSSVSMLQSFNYPDHFVSYHDHLGNITITNNRSAITIGDANFRLVPGLADPSKVSFESVKKPGLYLRHQGWRVKLHKFDGTRLFREDATFKRVPGLADASWESFESQNYPGKFLRHRNFHLWVEGGEGELFRKDATFLPVRPPSLAQATDKEAGRTVYEAQTEKRADTLQYEIGSDTPFTGTLRNIYPNGQTSWEGSYVDGELNGPTTGWYENGQKKSSRFYMQEASPGGQRIRGGWKPAGTWTTWYENGQKKSEQRWVNGTIDGSHTTWHENGERSGEETRVNGKLQGKSTKWRRNGQKSSERTYVNGKKEGPETYWDEHGKRYAENNYIRGRKEGLQTVWYDNGQKKSEIQFLQDQKAGRATYWDQEGRKRLEELWKRNDRSRTSKGVRQEFTRWDEEGNVVEVWPVPPPEEDSAGGDRVLRTAQITRRGKLFYEQGSEVPYSGLGKDYHPNGEKKNLTTFVDGKPVGRQSHWYSSGKKAMEAEIDSEGAGHAIEWYEDGRKKSERRTLNGKVHGTRTTWHPNGQKKSEETHFRNGWPTTGTATTWHENGQMKYQETWGGGSMRERKCWDEEGTEIDGSCRR